MPGQGLGLGPLQLHDEMPQEAGMPVVLVGLEEVIGALEGEEVGDEAADGRAVADALVQDVGVRRGRDGVGAFGELGGAVADGVAEAFDGEPVRERVELEQDEVGRLAARVGRVVGEAPGVEPLREVFEAGDGLLGERDGLGVGFGEGAAEGGAEERGDGG